MSAIHVYHTKIDTLLCDDNSLNTTFSKARCRVNVKFLYLYCGSGGLQAARATVPHFSVALLSRPKPSISKREHKHLS